MQPCRKDCKTSKASPRVTASSFMLYSPTLFWSGCGKIAPFSGCDSGRGPERSLRLCAHLPLNDGDLLLRQPVHLVHQPVKLSLQRRYFGTLALQIQQLLDNFLNCSAMLS